MALDIKNLIKLDVLMKLPLPKKLAILAGICILVVGVFYQFIFSPKFVKITELDDKLDALMVKLELDREIAKDIPKFQREKKELEIKLDKVLSQLPNEKQVDGLLESVHLMGEQSRLKINHFKPQREVPKGFYAEVPVSMDVVGSYSSIFNFTSKVGKLDRIVNISDIKMSVAKGKKSVKYGLDPDMKVSFKVTAFRFVDSAPSAGADK
jgi:type IV pilus assembly protein PilO